MMLRMALIRRVSRATRASRYAQMSTATGSAPSADDSTSRADAGAVPAAGARVGGKRLTMANMNPRVVEMQYAVRGLLPQVAEQIHAELEKDPEVCDCLPGSSAMNESFCVFKFLII
jgi:hypothetical protein